jgi:cell division protein FtsB
LLKDLRLMEARTGSGSAQATQSISPIKREGGSGIGDRRTSRASREELRFALSRAELQRRFLAGSTVALLLACIGLTLWAFNQQSARHAAQLRQQAQIEGLSEKLDVATASLEETRQAVDGLANDRIPGLLPFKIDEPLFVDTPFVRELSFTLASPPATGHECRVVLENNSNSIIRPTLSVALFDSVGIQLAGAQLVDGSREALRANEIRSFFVTLEALGDRAPIYYHLFSN